MRIAINHQGTHWLPGADRGATTVEYALIASLIAVVVIVGVVLLGSNLLGLFDESASSYANAS